MKPIEETKTITVYKCPDCKKEHGGTVRAEQCCACTVCGGPTTAEDRKFARGGSPSGYYRHDLACAWCCIRKQVKSQQDCVRRYEQGVEHAKRTLEGAQRNLADEQRELALLIAKRDALPPKPRAPKERGAV
jgi:hypothetical protein